MACFHLINRCVLSVSGDDAKTFLQGLITNDINKINSDTWMYAMMLSPQGKFHYDFFITQNNDDILLDCQSSKQDEIIKKLMMYKLRSKVEIKKTALQVYACDEKITQNFMIDPRNSEFGYRAAIEAAPAQCEAFEAYELKRMALLIPDADADLFFDKSFPLEFGANELNAIDYKKGCYLGQELTARTHYRGTIRKQIKQIELIDTTLAKGNEIVSVEGIKVGIVLGKIGQTGLGLINIEEALKAKQLNGIRVI